MSFFSIFLVFLAIKVIKLGNFFLFEGKNEINKKNIPSIDKIKEILLCLEPYDLSENDLKTLIDI